MWGVHTWSGASQEKVTTGWSELNSEGRKEPVLQTFRDKGGSFRIREDSLAGQDIYSHMNKRRNSWGTGMCGSKLKGEVVNVSL